MTVVRHLYLSGHVRPGITEDDKLSLHLRYDVFGVQRTRQQIYSHTARQLPVYYFAWLGLLRSCGEQSLCKYATDLGTKWLVHGP